MDRKRFGALATERVLSVVVGGAAATAHARHLEVIAELELILDRAPRRR